MAQATRGRTHHGFESSQRPQSAFRTLLVELKRAMRAGCSGWRSSIGTDLAMQQQCSSSYIRLSGMSPTKTVLNLESMTETLAIRRLASLLTFCHVHPN